MDEMKFEQALAQLEEIVKSLEEGELPLEESLKKFEVGIGLSRFCAKKLDEAQEKMEILLSDENGAKIMQPFNISQKKIDGSNEEN